MKSLFISIISLFIFISCREKEEQFETNIDVLKKYIYIPNTIKKVKYQIVETPIRMGGQDCKVQLSIYAVLELSKKDFDSIVSLSDKKYTFPIQISSDSYKIWYSDLVKKQFVKKDNESVMLLPPIYDGVFFTKKKSNTQPLFFTTEDNEIFLIYKVCK